MKFNRKLVIAESTCEFRTGLPLSQRWVGPDRVYVTLTLSLDRFTPVLIAQVMGNTRRWEVRGWRAITAFEALSSKMVEPKELGERGMRSAA